MAAQTGNVFKVKEFGREGGWVHGQAFAAAAYDWRARKHRGIDVAAGFDVQAGLQGEARHGFLASLLAGANVGAGVSLTAAFPLDLFQEAGFVARLRAEAEAAVFIEAQLGLEAEVFRGAIRQRLTGPWRELAEVFLSELEVRAGVGARAAFSAELLAEAALVGNLLRVGEGPDSIPPGFTFSFQYRAGVKLGTGMHFLANLGFADPQRLLDRLSDRLAIILADGIERKVRSLPPNEADAARAALPYCELLLPVACRTALALGATLARPGADHRQAAQATVVRGFVREAQRLLLRALLDLAFHELAQVLGSDPLVQRVRALPDDRRSALAEALRAAATLVVKAATRATPEPGEWLGTFVALLDPLMRVLDAGLLDAAEADRWKRNVALLWSAAVLAKRVARGVGAGDDGANPFDAGATPMPGDGRVAEYVAGVLGRQPPAGPADALTSADAAEFLARIANDHGLVAAVGQAAPPLGRAVAWLGEALGPGGGGLARRVLRELAEADEITAAGLFDALFQAVRPKVEDEVIARVLRPLKGADADPDLRDVLQQIATPALRSLIRVVPDGVRALGNESAAKSLREKVSVVLLQCLSRFLLITVDRLTEAGLDGAGTAIRGLAARVESPGMGGGLEAYDKIARACKSSPLRLDLAAPEVAEVLRVAAGALDRIRVNSRKPVIDALGRLISLGLSSDDPDFDQVWTRLDADATSPPVPADTLAGLMAALQHGAADLFNYVVAELRRLLLAPYLAWADQFIRAVRDAVAQAVTEAQAQVTYLQGRVQSAEAEIQRVTGEIQARFHWIGQAAGELSNDLTGRNGGVANGLRELAWNRTRDALFNNWGYKQLPGRAKRPVEDAAIGAFNAAWDGVAGLIAAPMGLLGAVGGWVYEAQTAERPQAWDADALSRYVKDRVYAYGAADLVLAIHVKGEVDIPGPWDIPYNIDLGRVTVGGGEVLDAFAAVVALGLTNFLDWLVDLGRQLRAVRDELAANQSALAAIWADLQAKLAWGPILTNLPLSVSITSPVADGAAFGGPAPVRVQVRGATLPFVGKVPGLEPRVRLLFNGSEHPCPADWWSSTRDGVELWVEAARPGTPAAGRPRIELEPGLHALQVAATDGLQQVTSSVVQFYLLPG